MAREGIIRLKSPPHSPNEIQTIFIPSENEAVLFSLIGNSAPAEIRRSDADVIIACIDILDGTLWEQAWRDFASSAAKAFQEGKTPEPFKRQEASLNRDLLRALSFVLKNEGAMTLRRLSSRIFNDSKRLEQIEARLENLLQQFAPPDKARLEAWNIANHPPVLHICGPLQLDFGEKKFSSDCLNSPYALSFEDIAECSSILTSASRLVSIENLTIFRELSELKLNDLFIWTSYPSRSVISILTRLPHDLTMYHWGDTDPYGYDILRVLRKKSGRLIRPLHMDRRPNDVAIPLNRRETQLVENLINDPIMEDLHLQLRGMQEANDKGCFEQESLPQPRFPFPFLHE